MNTIRSITSGEAEYVTREIVARVDQDRGKRVSIAVFDGLGNLLMFLNTGAKPVTIQLAIAKAHTAILVAKPTLELHLAGTNPALYADPRVTCFGGGVPIVVDGQVIGAIGVSGRKASCTLLKPEVPEDAGELGLERLQDHELAAMAAELLQRSLAA